MTKLYYIYKITFPDLSYYIGYRGSCQEASDDFLVKYFSSSKVVQKKITESEYSGEILRSALDQKTAYGLEQELIHANIDDPLCLNKVCYYGREGFGLLTASAKEKIRLATLNRWQDETFKAKMVQTHKERWTDDRKAAQSIRLTGVKRPEHSAKMLGRPGNMKCKGVKKHEGFGALVSASSLGKPKSATHKEKLRVPKRKVVSRIMDKREMGMGNFMNWCRQQDILLLAQEKRV